MATYASAAITDRRSGRTTRALKRAAQAATDGASCFYLVRNAHMRTYMLDILRGLAPDSVSVSTSTAKFGGGFVRIIADDNRVEEKMRGYSNPVLMSDHSCWDK